MNVEKYIDHTLLKATATPKDIEQLCAEANACHFASVCVNPVNVQLAHELLLGSDVAVCTVIGFPLGANTSDVKAYDMKQSPRLRWLFFMSPQTVLFLCPRK